MKKLLQAVADRKRWTAVLLMLAAFTMAISLTSCSDDDDDDDTDTEDITDTEGTTNTDDTTGSDGTNTDDTTTYTVTFYCSPNKSSSATSDNGIAAIVDENGTILASNTAVPIYSGGDDFELSADIELGDVIYLLFSRNSNSGGGIHFQTVSVFASDSEDALYTFDNETVVAGIASGTDKTNIGGDSYGTVELDSYVYAYCKTSGLQARTTNYITYNGESYSFTSADVGETLDISSSTRHIYISTPSTGF